MEYNPMNITLLINSEARDIKTDRLPDHQALLDHAPIQAPSGSPLPVSKLLGAAL